MDYELGVDGADWRADWALLEPDAEKQVKNEARRTVILPLQEQCWLVRAKELAKLPSRYLVRVQRAATGDVYAFFIDDSWCGKQKNANRAWSGPPR